MMCIHEAEATAKLTLGTCWWKHATFSVIYVDKVQETTQITQAHTSSWYTCTTCKYAHQSELGM